MFWISIAGYQVKWFKSKVQFSEGTNKVVQKKISDILQIALTNSIGTYLGCSTFD